MWDPEAVGEDDDKPVDARGRQLIERPGLAMRGARFGHALLSLVHPGTRVIQLSARPLIRGQCRSWLNRSSTILHAALYPPISASASVAKARPRASPKRSGKRRRACWLPEIS